ALAHVVVQTQQVAGAQLKILEVEHGFAVLDRLVMERKAIQQLLQQNAVARGDLVERGLLDRAARLVVRGGALAPALEPAQVEQPQSLGLGARTELGECGLERLTAEDEALRLVQLPEARVEPSGERIRLQKPVAETVDRRDPRAVELTREIDAPELGQLPPDS